VARHACDPGPVGILLGQANGYNLSPRGWLHILQFPKLIDPPSRTRWITWLGHDRAFSRQHAVGRRAAPTIRNVCVLREGRPAHNGARLAGMAA
jgi:hypothetical protein